MLGPLRYNVDIGPEGDGYVLRCHRLNGYTWKGPTPEAALEAFTEDIRALVEQFQQERRPLQPEGFHSRA